MMKALTDRIFITEAEPEVDRPCMGYIKGSNASLLVDAGNSPAHAAKLKGEMRELELKEPDMVVLTHSHWDHSFGLCSWKAETYAGTRTNEYLRKMVEWSWQMEEFEQHVDSNEIPLFCKPHMLLEFPELRQLQEQKDIPMTAKKEISEKTVFDLGGIHCEVFPVVSPHVDDCLLIYVPEERVLFSGDAHCPEVFGVDWIDEKERLSAFIRTLEPLEFDRCVTGHSDVMTKEELLKELRERESVCT